MQKRGTSFFLAAGAMTLVSLAGGTWIHAQQNATVKAAIPESPPIPSEQIPRVAGERRGTTDRFILIFRKP